MLCCRENKVSVSEVNKTVRSCVASCMGFWDSDNVIYTVIKVLFE